MSGWRARKKGWRNDRLISLASAKCDRKAKKSCLFASNLVEKRKNVYNGIGMNENDGREKNTMRSMYKKVLYLFFIVVGLTFVVFNYVY
ncbi:hypothetical protein M493_07947 [Geobacillus genomosp. 3]|uniref:Transmembrane protein n=1 Tax=Geobacillus genomosp. 3 TaxID=1921421 RepID=V5LVQ5_GEOG3|nr:hypothetical protein M493_07947 [Geobacillus genomosp. 3]